LAKAETFFGFERFVMMLLRQPANQGGNRFALHRRQVGLLAVAEGYD
jgi:hypothetical protein